MRNYFYAGDPGIEDNCICIYNYIIYLEDFVFQAWKEETSLHTQTCAMVVFVLGVGVGLKLPSLLKAHERYWKMQLHTAK